MKITSAADAVRRVGTAPRFCSGAAISRRHGKDMAAPKSLFISAPRIFAVRSESKPQLSYLPEAFKRRPEISSIVFREPPCVPVSSLTEMFSDVFLSGKTIFSNIKNIFLLAQEFSSCSKKKILAEIFPGGSKVPTEVRISQKQVTPRSDNS